MSLNGIKVIAFDADDTLWVNEPLFRTAEKEFCELIAPYVSESHIEERLSDIIIQNLVPYGYGIKPFALSLIEAAITLSEGTIPLAVITTLITKGKQMLDAPVVVIEDIESVLKTLSKQYRLVVATKGDLLDQERKLVASGLASYFHHIEVMSDKTPAHYRKLIGHLDSTPNEFLMIGNSLKSDILPVLEIGAHAIHIPFHTTWVHEQVEEPVVHQNFKSVSKVDELMRVL